MCLSSSGVVSIPQLGWGDFKLLGAVYIVNLEIVSIPQLGWGDFKLFRGQSPRRKARFQSLNWDGVISNIVAPIMSPVAVAFQSLNWDGVISNLPNILPGGTIS